MNEDYETPLKQFENRDSTVDTDLKQFLPVSEDNETPKNRFESEHSITDTNLSAEDVPTFESGQNHVPILESGQYHAFISHSSTDKEFANELCDSLEKKGFRCFLADRNFHPGASIVANMNLGISKSRRTIIIASRTFVKSLYYDFEVSEAIHHQSKKRQCVVVPLLYNIDPNEVPTSLKGVTYIEHGKNEWFEKLTKSLREDRPLTATIPAGDVAHGLAWSYYYSYLRIILPGLEHRVRESKYWPQTESDLRILPKFISILPVSCRCPGSLREVDENFETQPDKVEYHADMAGVVGRDYSSYVHKVRHPDTGKEYLFLGEFATPLRTLHHMEKGGLAGLSSEQRLHQMKLFHQKLQEILVHPSLSDTHSKYLLIYYQAFHDPVRADVESCTGSGVLEKVVLSKLLAETIQHELDKEDRVVSERPTL